MGATTARVLSYLFARRKRWNIHLAIRPRVRFKSGHHRLPEICVVMGPRPTEPVLTSPPFLCIEVLSPSDNLNRMRRRIADFLKFGVPYVWLIDPRTLAATVITADGEMAVIDGILRAGEMEVPMTELYDS